MAKGAFVALETQPGMLPRERLTIAMRAAERHLTGVRGPFTILSIPG